MGFMKEIILSMKLLNKKDLRSKRAGTRSQPITCILNKRLIVFTFSICLVVLKAKTHY